MVVDFELGEQAPCIQGHFPAAPVVPGAWLLGKIDLAFSTAYPDCHIVTFSKVKFLAPLLPNERARLVFDYAGEGKTRFVVSVDDKVIVQANAVIAHAA